MKAKVSKRQNSVALIIPKEGFASMLLLEGVAQQHDLKIGLEDNSETIAALFSNNDAAAATRICAYINANL